MGVEEWSLKLVQFLERTSSKVLKGRGGGSLSSPGVEERGSERASAIEADRHSDRRPQAQLKDPGRI